MSRMRRKNRQIKFTVDIPADCEDDGDFMEMLEDQLYDINWSANGEEDGIPINKVTMGDYVIEPEFDDE